MYRWETRYRCFRNIYRSSTISSFAQIIVARWKKNEGRVVKRKNKKNTVPVEQSFWNKVCPFVGKRKFYCAVMKTYRAVKDSFNVSSRTFRNPHSWFLKSFSILLIRSRFAKISRNFLPYLPRETFLQLLILDWHWKNFLHSKNIISFLSNN